MVITLKCSLFSGRSASPFLVQQLKLEAGFNSKSLFIALILNSQVGNWQHNATPTPPLLQPYIAPFHNKTIWEKKGLVLFVCVCVFKNRFFCLSRDTLAFLWIHLDDWVRWWCVLCVLVRARNSRQKQSRLASSSLFLCAFQLWEMRHLI